MSEPYYVTVRPWNAAGGSTVHDEAIRVDADSPREAIAKVYAANEYDFKQWRIIDVEPIRRALASQPAPSEASPMRATHCEKVSEEDAAKAIAAAQRHFPDLKFSCDTCGRYMDKPCEHWQAWIAKPQPTQPVASAGEPAAQAHEPQLYTPEGPITGKEGKYTIAAVGCTCGWNSDGKSYLKAGDWFAHLPARATAAPASTPAEKWNNPALQKIANERDARFRRADTYAGILEGFALLRVDTDHLDGAAYIINRCEEIVKQERDKEHLPATPPATERGVQLSLQQDSWLRTALIDRIKRMPTYPYHTWEHQSLIKLDDLLEIVADYARPAAAAAQPTDKEAGK